MTHAPRNVLIADDEPLARDRIRRLIDDIPDYRVCGEAADGDSALKQVAELGPDIVLLDIRMPGMDGMDAAAAISELDNPPAVIFCTAYDHYAIKAFEVRAAAYLLKPVRREALAEALARTGQVNRVQQQALSSRGADAGGQLAIKSHRGTELIDIGAILYCEADQKYVTIHHTRGETVSDYTLKELENSHPPGIAAHPPPYPGRGGVHPGPGPGRPWPQRRDTARRPWRASGQPPPHQRRQAMAAGASAGLITKAPLRTACRGTHGTFSPRQGNLGGHFFSLARHLMSKRTLRIATRSSALALWQAEFIKSELERLHDNVTVELVKIKTQGDKILDVPLAKIGGKGLFVKELEEAMIDGRADLAVHSMKDVPMEFPEGLGLVAICEREDPTDAFVSNHHDTVDALPPGRSGGHRQPAPRIPAAGLPPGPADSCAARQRQHPSGKAGRR